MLARRVSWTKHRNGPSVHRRSFTPEFKAEAVRLCQIGDRTTSRIAIDLMVSTLNPGPFEVRVIWDTGASKTIGGMHEEEAFFRRADHVRLGVGIDRRDDCGDMSEAGGLATNVLSMEEKVWRDGTHGDPQTQAP